MDLPLTSREKEKMREIIQRMIRNEPGLYTKSVGKFKIVKTTSLPKLLAKLVCNDIKRKRLIPVKGLEVDNVKILVLRYG